MGYKVIVVSRSKEVFSAFTLDVYPVASHEEAIKLVEDADHSLRQSYAWVPGGDWFYAANILAFEVTPRGDCEFGLRYFCLTDEEVAKECAARKMDVAKCMETRAAIRAKPAEPYAFIARFKN
jgi:hypothetical protein